MELKEQIIDDIKKIHSETEWIFRFYKTQFIGRVTVLDRWRGLPRSPLVHLLQ